MVFGFFYRILSVRLRKIKFEARPKIKIGDGCFWAYMYAYNVFFEKPDQDPLVRDADPDPYQNVTDPQHCSFLGKSLDLLGWYGNFEKRKEFVNEKNYVFFVRLCKIEDGIWDLLPWMVIYPLVWVVTFVRGRQHLSSESPNGESSPLRVIGGFSPLSRSRRENFRPVWPNNLCCVRTKFCHHMIFGLPRF